MFKREKLKRGEFELDGVIHTVTGFRDGRQGRLRWEVEVAIDELLASSVDEPWNCNSLKRAVRACLA